MSDFECTVCALRDGRVELKDVFTVYVGKCCMNLPKKPFRQIVREHSGYDMIEVVVFIILMILVGSFGHGTAKDHILENPGEYGLQKIEEIVYEKC